MLRLYAGVMVVTTGAALAAALLATRTAPQYSASAEVLVEPTITPSGNYIQPSMPTEQRVATSTKVVGASAKLLDIRPKDLLDHLSVTVPVDTQVLVVTYTDDTADAAWSGVNAVVKTYLKTQNPADGENPVASLVGPPEVPSAPVTTNYPVILGVAVFGGLVMGFGLAWAWDRVRGRIRTTDDAERHTGLEALAVVAEGPAGRVHVTSLAARMVGLFEGEARPSLLVTGVGDRTSTTNVAVESAQALTAMGHPVVLVTADPDVGARLARGRLRGPSPSPSLEPAPGTEPTGLHLVPVAAWDVGGVATAGLAQLLPGLHDRVPGAWVVIDGPPAWQCAAMSLGVNKILMVVTPGHSSRASAMAAVQSLAHCREKLMGLVIAPRRPRIRRLFSFLRTRTVRRVRLAGSRLLPPASTEATLPHPLRPDAGQGMLAPQVGGTVAVSARKTPRPPRPTRSGSGPERLCAIDLTALPDPIPADRLIKARS